MILGGDTVAVVRAGAIPGPDLQPVDSWKPADVTVTLYTGSSFQPLASNENVAGQQRTEATHQAFLRAGADVTSRDRIRHEGLDYVVDGKPERWRIGGVEDHVEVRCFRVEGG